MSDSAFLPIASMPSLVVSKDSADRPTNTRSAPACASAIAIAEPIPLLDPVTRARLP